MPVLVTVDLPIKEEKWDDALATFRSILPDTRAFDGCEGVTTYLHPETHRILLAEHWTSSEHQGKYMAWRVETGFMEQAGELLAGEPEFVTWDNSDI